MEFGAGSAGAARRRRRGHLSRRFVHAGPAVAGRGAALIGASGASRRAASNLGVSGYGTTQALLKLEATHRAIKPRAIVLLFFAWNDLRDNFPYPEIYYGPQRTTRPYLIVTPDGPSSLPVRWASSFERRCCIRRPTCGSSIAPPSPSTRASSSGGRTCRARSGGAPVSITNSR